MSAAGSVPTSPAPPTVRDVNAVSCPSAELRLPATVPPARASDVTVYEAASQPTPDHEHHTGRAPAL